MDRDPSLRSPDLNRIRAGQLKASRGDFVPSNAGQPFSIVVRGDRSGCDPIQVGDRIFIERPGSSSNRLLLVIRAYKRTVSHRPTVEKVGRGDAHMVSKNDSRLLGLAND